MSDACLDLACLDEVVVERDRSLIQRRRPLKLLPDCMFLPGVLLAVPENQHITVFSYAWIQFFCVVVLFLANVICDNVNLFMFAVVLFS